MTRAIIYARVSTEEQGKGYSIPTQLEACRRYAAERGYTVMREFVDTYTGTEIDRPGIDALRGFLRSESVDVLIVYDVDRLSREVVGQAILEQELTALGLGRIEYVLGGDDSTPSGELLKLVKSAIAQYENRQRVERMRRGKNGRVQAGYPLVPFGRAPYGYRYISEGKHRGRLEIREDEAEVVREMYRWLVEEGLSCYAIARRLYERGIPTRGDTSAVVGAVKKAGRCEWSPRAVQRILSNPANKGTWYWGKRRMVRRGGKSVSQRAPREEWIAVSVPAIVSSETWERAQEQMRLNRERAARNARRNYLLRGLIFCPCGRRRVGRYKVLAGGGGIGYYRCPSTEREPWRLACPYRFSVRQDRVEEAVWRAVADFLMRPENLEAELERRRKEQAQVLADLEKRGQAAERALEDVDRKLSLLLDQVLTGDFPRAVIEREKAELLSQRAELEAELARLKQERESACITPEQEVELRNFAAMVAEGIARATFREKRRILELLRVRVDVLDEDTVRISGIIGGPEGAIVGLSIG